MYNIPHLLLRPYLANIVKVFRIEFATPDSCSILLGPDGYQPRSRWLPAKGRKDSGPSGAGRIVAGLWQPVEGRSDGGRSRAGTMVIGRGPEPWWPVESRSVPLR
jgi:hypothetical protein